MAKTISWQRSCLWLSCCWTLAACTPWTAAAAASHLVQMTPPAVVMVIGGRGDGPDPGSPAPAPTQQQQRTADSTITHPYRNPTVVSAQAPEAATVSAPVNNAPTAPAANANPSRPSPPPPAEAQTTVASSPSSTPSGALIPTPTPTPTAPITPSTPATKTQPAESSPPTLPSPANETNAPTIPSSAPPSASASVGKPTVKTQAARSSTVKEEEPLPLCDIDPCVHLQPSCPELKEAKGWSCTCPGGGGASSGASSTTAPGPVVALEVTRVWPQSAGVRWCAPYSSSPPLTSSFLVWALRQTDGSVAVSNASVSSRARRTDVFGLEAGHGYLLCVSAASGGNDGVGSAVSHTRCVPVSTPRDGEVIATYVLAGGCAVLVLTAAVLSVCLHRQCERGRASGGGGAPPPAALLLNNPTTAAVQMAQMVSIANPAYAHPEERAPVNAHHTQSREQQAKKSTNVNRK